MTMPNPGSRWIAAALALGASFIPGHACGACGCTLNSDWASQGYTAMAGFRVDLRQDYFNQDQLRAGTGAPARSGFPIPNSQELQQETLSRNTTLTLDYFTGNAWGLNLVVPYFNRFHTTIGGGDTEVSTSRREGLGDIRVTARYQGLTEDPSFGVQAGFKLPTGSRDQTFSGGPQAGSPLDRGLQMGTGTTDLLFGVYKNGSLGEDWGYFSQAMGQVALKGRDGFRPGNAMNANAGVRYTGNPVVAPHVQMNFRMEARETGENSDTPNSGATLAYLSPGLTIQAGARVQFYGFVQVPVLQRVNGLQVEPRSIFSAGVHCTF